MPAISLSVAPDGVKAGFASVELRGLDGAVIEALRRRHLARADWERGFAVFSQSLALEDDRTPILAEYELIDDGVRLTPAYPWVGGLAYTAKADLGSLGLDAISSSVELSFSVRRSGHGPLTAVDSIFPSGWALPENLLRFYVNFSAPMQQGRTQDQITLVDEDGRPVADALYRPPVELWDSSMRRLTVLLDPGRLKRGVGPNARLGPPLKAGQLYALSVGAGMVDATGRALRETFVKVFRAEPAVWTRLRPAQWRISAPPRGTLDPLRLDVPVPLDCALGPTAIAVIDDAGNGVAGQAALDRDERRWTFTPRSPWPLGELNVQIDPDLEDVCGNSVRTPFDRRAGDCDGRDSLGASLRVA